MSSDAQSEAVLFLHSTGTGPFLWAGVPDAAIGARSRLLPANLGYPPNPLVERGRVVTPADDAVEVLRSVPAGVRVHVVAHSYGALVALHAIRTAPERFASVFFFEPVVFGALASAEDAGPEASEEARSFAAHPWFLHDGEKGGRAEWLEAFIDYWNRPGSWSKMPEPMRELSLMLGWKMFQEVRACFLDETPFDAWTLPGPTTIAVGERTTSASQAMSRRLARGRANVTLVGVPGVGHMAPLTHATKVHEELARHMARFDAQRGDGR
ncbi:MAG: alpha/beta hydrolase [Labilithrix sp.]|nr:alpha/beta hydrolase [Labilithrix sp.]